MLTVDQLFVSGNHHTTILRGISLCVDQGMCVGLTGASGSGKTTLIRSILGMDQEELHTDSGDIILNGQSILQLSHNKRRSMCGKTFGFIPQLPMTSFFRNVVIGKQIVETLRLHTGFNKQKSLSLAEECLTKVNLTDTKRVLNAYPSQLSGGMLQRVTMAIILGIQPSYILADEPTSALDKENRELLIQLLYEYGKHSGILFISHDDEAIRQLCSKVYVMQDGCIIEENETEKLFCEPVKPWTQSFVLAAKQHMEGIGQWKQLH